MRTLREVPPEYQMSRWDALPIPYRPWWRNDEESKGRFVVRTDGVIAIDEEEAEAIDQAKPLPHPGYRVGQIWVVLFPQMSMVVGPLTALDLVEPSRTHNTVMYGLEDYGPLLRLAHKVLKNTPIINTGWGIESGSILLVDPCRPELAPWASS
jgi:hypothetical protein